MDANPLQFVAAGRSHSIMLLAKLLDLGIISGGKFTWVHVSHDDDCPALTSSILDCVCDPEVEICGHRYLFSEIVGEGHP